MCFLFSENSFRVLGLNDQMKCSVGRRAWPGQPRCEYRARVFVADNSRYEIRPALNSIRGTEAMMGLSLSPSLISWRLGSLRQRPVRYYTFYWWPKKKTAIHHQDDLFTGHLFLSSSRVVHGIAVRVHQCRHGSKIWLLPRVRPLNAEAKDAMFDDHL